MKFLSYILLALLFSSFVEAQDWSSRNLTDNGTSKNFINLNYRNCGGLLFFAGGSSTFTYNNEAWVSNGTFAGTFPISSLNPGLPIAYSPAEFTKVGNTVFFAATDATNGRELWKCDLTTFATTLVKNIRPTSASSSPHSLAECNGKLLFVCDADNSTVNGDELWISDGTAAGTVLLKDIIPGKNDSGIDGEITTIAGIAYFDANSYSGGGSALWRSDGTADGTYLLVDAGVTSAFPGTFTRYQGNTYFFMINSGSSGNYSLWRSTGTSAELIKNSVADRRPDAVAIANNQMFFRGYDSASGEEVWKSNGTDVGTVRVTQVGPGSTSGLDDYYGSPSEIVAMGNNIYFVGTDGSTGKQLWRTDGTESGTEMVELISNTAGASAPNPNGLIVFNNTLFFRMTSDGYGLEWFTSDGSSISSEPAVELWPGTNSIYTSITKYQTAYTGEQVVIGNSLFFCGSDPSVYQELWRIGLPLKISTQPQSQIVALGSAVTFTVASNSTASISYGWKKNGVKIPGEVASTYSIASAGLTDAGDYTAQLESDDGTAGSTIAQLAVVNTNIAPVSIASGGTINISVATAAPPGATLTYQWRRGDTLLADGPIESEGLISGATTSKLSITKATAYEAGSYTCTVAMGSINLTTQPANVTVVEPLVVLTHPQSRILATASSVTFNAAATNASGVSYQWLHNGAAISRATSSSYTIASLALSHAGEYRCQMTNAAGSIKTNVAKLAVVKAPFTTINVADNGVLKLTVSTAAPSTIKLVYSWRQNSDTLSNGVLASGASVSGVTTNAVTIGKIKLSEAGDYFCTIGMDGLSLTTKVATVNVLQKPIVADMVVPTAAVSRALNWQLSASQSPTGFIISGLPSGLKANLVTGLITGVPNKKGQSTIKVSAKNVAGTGPVKEFVLNVDELTPGLAGTYTGLVVVHSEIAPLGGTIFNVITSTGELSGTLKLGAKRYSFKGRAMVPETGDPVAVVTVTLSRTLRAKLTLSFTTESSASYSGDSTFSAGLESGDFTAQIEGRRLSWSKTNLPTAWAGTYNVLIKTPPNPDYPRGMGYMQMKINGTSGVVSITGRTGDGTFFTGSQTLWNNGRLPFYSLLYNERGYLMGLPQIEATIGSEDNWLWGSLNWQKIGPSSTTDKLYSLGFGEIPVDLEGSKWLKPKAQTMLFDLPNQANNARVEFSEAGIEDVAQADSVSQTFQITSANTAKFATSSTGNPCLVSMKLNTSTGFFSGTFTLKDPKPSSAGTVSRKVSYSGILIDHLQEGYGWFRLTGLTSPIEIKAGLVRLKRP